jgi:hypothetical protein
MFKFGINSKRLWRPLIGIVVAYAVAAQSLLIALGGFNLAAHAGEAQPTFELCLHGGQSSPDLPVSVPGHPGCTHCIFCFAGSHHALLSAPPTLLVRRGTDVVDPPWIADTSPLPRLSAHSIANPRGPPRGA